MICDTAWWCRYLRQPTVASPQMRMHLYFVILLLAATALAQAPPVSLAPREHPNHYIVVVDSSGSIQNRFKAPSLRQALDFVVDGLYGDGFGTIPPYDTEHDELSLHHWGIVQNDGSPQQPIERLHLYDLSGIIHPRMIRERGLPRETLAQAVWPRESYGLSFLSFAEELALHSSLPKAPGGESHRTFLIEVDDRSPNGASVCDERDDLEKGRPRSLIEVLKKVDEVGQKYEIRRIHEERFPHGDSALIYVNVYEVQSREAMHWRERLTWASPLIDTTLVWNDETTGSAAGTATVKLAEGLKNLGAPATLTISGSGITGRAKWSLAQGTTVTIQVHREGHLSCEATPVKVTFLSSPQRSDALLGMSAYDYRAVLSLRAPPPSRCSLAHRARIAGLWSLFGGAMLLGLTAVGVRAFRTPLWAKLPGVARLVGLNWGGPIEYRVMLAVNPGKQFVRLHLPPYFIQVLSYYGSVLSVGGPAAQGLRWNHQTDLFPVRLPIRARTLSLLWTEGAQDDSWAEITFKAGTRAARLRLGAIPLEQGTEP